MWQEKNSWKQNKMKNPDQHGQVSQGIASPSHTSHLATQAPPLAPISFGVTQKLGVTPPCHLPPQPSLTSSQWPEPSELLP